MTFYLITVLDLIKSWLSQFEIKHEFCCSDDWSEWPTFSSVRFLSWECRVFQRWHKDIWRNPKTSKNFWRHPKSCVDSGRGFPGPVSRCVLLDMALLPVLSIWRRKYCHLHIVFISYIGLNLHIFGNNICVKQSCNHTHFSISCENSACKHEQVYWDIEVFNSQVWDSCLRHESWVRELAGLVTSKHWWQCLFQQLVIRMLCSTPDLFVMAHFTPFFISTPTL